ncbi:hypothetical protein JCM8202_004343 [Rhodotorula sphaerocarpa]
MVRSRDEKQAYFNRLKDYIETYPSIFVVNVDNVGSNQMHQIRQAIRGNGTILMGKNTMVRRAIRLILADHPDFERFLPLVKGNVGFVFTSGDLKETRDLIVSNKVAAPAKAGALAPNDIIVPAGNTGMEPGKTSFFQALQVPTKIARGTIEIVSDVHLVAAGDRVDASQAVLLNMLGISPFTYGMKIIQIFSEGQLFPESVLDVSEDELLERFMSGVKSIAAISLAINYPTLASVTHSLVNSYKNLLAVALETDYSFPEAEALKDRLANPDAYAAAAPAASTGAAAGGAAAEEKPAEAEEESDDDMGFGLFAPRNLAYLPSYTSTTEISSSSSRIDQIVQGFSLDEPFTLRSTAALGNLSAFNLYHKRIHLAICLASWLLHTQQPLLLTTRSGKIANLV